MISATSILVTAAANSMWAKKKKRKKRGRAGEKRNSSDVHGITSHSSAQTELVRFKKRWCHPMDTNEKLGEDKRKDGETEEQSTGKQNEKRGGRQEEGLN